MKTNTEKLGGFKMSFLKDKTPSHVFVQGERFLEESRFREKALFDEKFYAEALRLTLWQDPNLYATGRASELRESVDALLHHWYWEITYALRDKN